jgi:hypothetical protein
MAIATLKGPIEKISNCKWNEFGFSALPGGVPTFISQNGNEK